MHRARSSANASAASSHDFAVAVASAAAQAVDRAGVGVGGGAQRRGAVRGARGVVKRPDPDPVVAAFSLEQRPHPPRAKVKDTKIEALRIVTGTPYRGTDCASGAGHGAWERDVHGLATVWLDTDRGARDEDRRCVPSVRCWT